MKRTLTTEGTTDAVAIAGPATSASSSPTTLLAARHGVQLIEQSAEVVKRAQTSEASSGS
jgi:hypothetical protein